MRTGSLLSRQRNTKNLISVLVEQSTDITRSDLCCLYLYGEPDENDGSLTRVYKRGMFPAPKSLNSDSELVDFIGECDEAVVLLEKKTSPFSELLLTPGMNSGIALPLSVPTMRIGVLILNSRLPFFYNREKIAFLDSIVRLAGGIFYTTRAYEELREAVEHDRKKF